MVLKCTWDSAKLRVAKSLAGRQRVRALVSVREDIRKQGNMEEYDPITLGVLWSRLISTVDEAAASLQRTAFSTVAAESNDLACSLFDSGGSQLAPVSYTHLTLPTTPYV